MKNFTLHFTKVAEKAAVVCARARITLTHESLRRIRTADKLAPVLANRVITNGGYTVSPFGQFPVSGWAVALPGNECQYVPQDTAFTFGEAQEIIRGYLESRYDIVTADGRNHFGGWVDGDSGKLFLDISIVVAQKEVAIEIAKLHKQLAIFNLATYETIYL